MKTTNKKNAQSRGLRPGLLIVLIAFALVALYLMVSGVKIGPGSMESRATEWNVLTAGDDALSLQEDLETLSEDETVAEEENLDALY